MHLSLYISLSTVVVFTVCVHVVRTFHHYNLHRYQNHIHTRHVRISQSATAYRSLSHRRDTNPSTLRCQKQRPLLLKPGVSLDFGRPTSALYMSSENDSGVDDNDNDDSVTPIVNDETLPTSSMIEKNEDKDVKSAGNSFIDMFAADDRKAPITTVSSPSKYKKSPIKSALADVPNEEIKGSEKTESELRAEILRLEAEKDQIVIDKQKLERDRSMMYDIDNFIMALIDIFARYPEQQQQQQQQQLPQESLDSIDIDKDDTAIDSNKHREGEEFVSLIKENESLIKKELIFRLAELASSGLTQREKEIYWEASDRLLRYIKITNMSMYTSLNKDVDREVDNEINNLANIMGGTGSNEMRIYDQINNKWVQMDSATELDKGSSGSSSTMNTTTTNLPPNPWKDAMDNPPSNKDSMGRTMVRFPAALPITMLPLILRAPEISKQDYDILKETVFSDDILNSTLSDYGNFLATFRYNIYVHILYTNVSCKYICTHTHTRKNTHIYIYIYIYTYANFYHFCFNISIIYAHIIFLSLFTLFHPRGVPTESVQETYRKAQARIDLVPGMSDRIRLFVLPEPIFSRGPNNQLGLTSGSTPTLEELKNPKGAKKAQAKRAMIEKYSGAQFEPVFTILSKEAIVKQPDGVELGFKAVNSIFTFGTVFVYTVDQFSLNNDFAQRALNGDEQVVSLVLPVIGGVIALQAVHDIGHAIAAKIHGVKLSLPLAIPSIQIGLFGTVTRFLTFPKSRKAIFDVSIAGPFAGFIASMACMLVGIDITSHATAAELLNYPAIPTGFFDYSILLHQLMEPLGSLNPPSTSDAIGQSKIALTSVHPLIAVGITGMFSNALNFLPIGRLDGGRVAMAIAGRRSANGISFAATLSQAVSLFTTSSPIPLFWGLFVVLFQRGFDIPPEVRFCLL